MANAIRPSTTILNISPAQPAFIQPNAFFAMRKVQPTKQSVQDPEQLARMLTDMQKYFDEATRPSRSIDRIGSVKFKDLVITTGSGTVPVVLNHGLGKPYQGWDVTRPRGAGVQGIFETSLPAGASNTSQIALIFPNAGTFDITVWP